MTLKKNGSDDLKVYTLDLGDKVLCDLCNKDYSNKQQTGGFLFNRSAVCPECAPKFIEIIDQHNERSMITAKPLPGEPFCQFVLRIRR